MLIETKITHEIEVNKEFQNLCGLKCPQLFSGEGYCNVFKNYLGEHREGGTEAFIRLPECVSAPIYEEGKR